MANKKDWEKTRTIYWSDELNDDFDETLKERPHVPQNYRYLRKFHVSAWLAYYFFAKPIMGTYCFFHGIKVKGKENLKELISKILLKSLFNKLINSPVNKYTVKI